MRFGFALGEIYGPDRKFGLWGRSGGRHILQGRKDSRWTAVQNAAYGQLRYALIMGVGHMQTSVAAAARAPSTKRGRTPEPDAKQGQFDPGGKTTQGKNAAYAVRAQLPCSRPVARAQGGFDGAGATAAAKVRWAGVLCGEQASRSQEEEDRKR